MSSLRTFFIVLAWIVASIFLLSGLDDLFYDVYYWLRWLFRRRFFHFRSYPLLSVEKMEAKEQQKIAILIPTWHESDVIYNMLTNACATLLYRNYDIFVGVYSNDSETQVEVERAAQLYPRIHPTQGPVAGPTTKADNLNAMYTALKALERQTGERYEILIIHDAEDVIHPVSLLLYNYLIPRKDMIQIPVFPKRQPFWSATHWTYADEFAENHTKDLIAREAMRAFVPSAGVGTAFSRRVAEFMLAISEQDLFDARNLTEDYEFGFRLYAEWPTSVFVQQKVMYEPQDRSRPREERPYEGEWIATRELFPNSFWAAVRQKARWIVGISMQSWAMIGWRGGISIRYNLLRDRKVLIACPNNMIAYAVFLYFLVYELLRRIPETSEYLIPIIWKGSPLWYLVLAATVLMANRLLQRAIAVGKVYGFRQALASIPRAVWSNFINFFATTRAIIIFFRTLPRGISNIAWDKTDHTFSSDAPPAGSAPAAARAQTEDTEALSEERVRAVLDQIKSTDEEQRIAAIRMIKRPDGPQVLDGLVACLQDESWRVCGEAARTLGFLRLPEAAEPLARACIGNEWTVRANAAKALAKLGPAGEKMLLRLLTSEDKYAREIALKTLEQTGVVDHYAGLIERVGRENAPEAVAFFSYLETDGPSPLAEALLKRLADRQNKPI